MSFRRFLLATTATIALAACGDSSTGPSDTNPRPEEVSTTTPGTPNGAGPTSPTTPPATSTPPAPTRGFLAITLAGLPPGGAASISITGPERTDLRISGGLAASEFSAGTYAITASAVLIAGVDYVPEPASQVVSVIGAQTTTVAITYRAVQRGALRLLALGLPEREMVSFELRTAWNTVVSSGRVYAGQPRVLEDLTPGTYTVMWSDANVELGAIGHLYLPGVTTQRVTVTPDATVEGTVTYSLVTGVLSLSVVGLPAGASAHWKLIDSNGAVYRDGYAFDGVPALVPGVIRGAYTLEWLPTMGSVAGSARMFVPEVARRQIDVVPSMAPVGIEGRYVQYR